MKPDTGRIEKFLGMRSDVSPERMGVGDLIDAVNVRFDTTGQAFRREGRQLKQAGAANSLWSDGDVTLMVFNNAICRVNPDFTLLPIVPGLLWPNVTHFARVNGLVYWSNGRQNGVIDPGNNTHRSWGMAVPQVLQASLLAGAMPAGRYHYAVTLMRSDGQESGASSSALIDVPEGGGVQIVAPASPDPEVIRAVLYLSTAGGQTLRRAAEIEPGQLGSYRGNTHDLGAPLMTQHLTPPPASNVFTLFAGRLWLGIEDAIFPSAPFSMDLFNLQDYLPVKGRVTMLAPQKDGTGLWVGTESHIQYLSGNDPAAMNIEDKLAEPVIPGTLVYVPGHKFGNGEFSGSDIAVWAGPRGLYAGLPLPGGKVLSLTEGRHPFSLSGQGAAFFDADRNHLLVSAT